ncbi:MAG: type II toxin-antitoxin system Phd/YefM family antitoxin [Candidatus Dormibacteria bacterium]
MARRNPPEHVTVAETKRRFADILGAVKHRGDRYVVERNGTPMAAIVPVDDVDGHDGSRDRRGALGFIGAFDDVPEFADILDEIVRERQFDVDRPVPDFSDRDEYPL